MPVPACWRTVLSAASVALAAVALTASPASAASSAPGGCPDVPTVNPFTPWNDGADYLLAPDGDIEAGAAAWTLAGGAHAVEGNETFAVGTAGDHRSLELPAGASATTAPMCIGEEHKTMRFFARTTAKGSLTVEAIYSKRNAKAKSVTLGAVRGDDAWAATEALPMRVNELAGDYDNAMSVSLRFTVRGNATWQLDDVYVDPFRMK
jgi:hypothetical protein